MPRRGNVTFSLAPEENLETLEVKVKPNGLPTQSPIASPDNDKKITSQITRQEKAIRFHAVNRVDIMLHILIAYYGTGLNVRVKYTEMQHGSCKGTKIERTFLHACHSSIFPSLFDYREGDLIEPSEGNRTSILHNTPFHDAMNVTVSLSEAVNQFDRKLEGNRGKASTGELNSTYAKSSLEIINLVSHSKIGPIEGINQFLDLLEQFYSNMETTYISQRTILSPSQARRLINDYERDAVLFLKGKSKKFVTRDYLEMRLGVTNPCLVRILPDDKKQEPQVLYLEPIEQQIEYPTEIRYHIKTGSETIHSSIKKEELPSHGFDSLIKLLKSPPKSQKLIDEILSEHHQAILNITHSRKHTLPSEKELLAKNPQLRNQLYRQKYDIIAREMLGEKYSSIPRNIPFEETINEETEILIREKKK